MGGRQLTALRTAADVVRSADSIADGMEAAQALVAGGWHNAMERAFVVLRSRGPAWDDSKPLEGQSGWAAHAAFMDALFEQGFAALVGPLEGTRDALLILRATSASEIQDRLALDPWTINGLLVTKQISAWQIRLGTLEG